MDLVSLQSGYPVKCIGGWSRANARADGGTKFGLSRPAILDDQFLSRGAARTSPLRDTKPRVRLRRAALQFRH